MAKYSSPWLPDDAAEYASNLRRDSSIRTKVRTFGAKGLVFKNDISKRILLDPEMEPVWKYLKSVGTYRPLPGPLWKHFLVSVQLGARGPQKRDLMLDSETKSDISDVKKHIKAIKRVIKRWEYDRSFIPFDGKPKLSDAKTARKDDSVPIELILDHIPKWMSLQTIISPPLSSPNHPDAAYHYFVREVYSFFYLADEKFNKWSHLARTSNATGLFPLCDSNKARGTCKDLAQEFASPF